MLSTLTVAEVRGRIDAALISAGYTRSRYAPELFGRDTDHLVPGSYSVSTPSTVIKPFDGREHYTDEGEGETVVEVRTAYRLRGDNQSGDYDRALDHEHQILRAVLALDATYLSLQIHGIPRRSVSPAGDWLVSLIRFTVFHRYLFA